MKMAKASEADMEMAMKLCGALTELVALKDIKDRGFGAHDTEGEDEYMRRKPVAWKAARAALAPNAQVQAGGAGLCAASPGTES